MAKTKAIKRGSKKKATSGKSKAKTRKTKAN
jgi:hypothetical protein